MTEGVKPDLPEFGAPSPTSPNRSSGGSTLRIRPSATPLGPRSRTKSVGALDASSPSSTNKQHSSPTPSSSSLPVDNPSSPISLSAPLISESMPVIIEGYETPGARDSPAPSTTSSVKPITKLPSLTVPPKISFESVPVQWKGLSLEAALWTFSSEELQKIVSRSIRASASESFIRLLSVDLLDKTFPAELQRLENAKYETQAQYRFSVQRRMMLLQAMNSRSSVPVTGKDAEEAMSVINGLTTQISQIVSLADQQVEELLRIRDQQAQINRMLDIHSASSLAIALRKLNSSYGKRTSGLNKARERIKQLETELEDAWKEAERLAQELDEYDAAMGTDDEGDVVISKAAVVSVPSSPPKELSIPRPMAPTYFTVESLSQNGSKLALAQSPPPTDGTHKFLDSPQMVPSEITISREPSAAQAQQIADDTTEERTAPPPPPKDEAKVPAAVVIISDTASIRSVKSNRSVRSTRSNKSSRVTVVSAARTRSHRVSANSLRLGHHQKKPSVTQAQAPPVPTLPTLKRSESKPNRFSSSLLSSKSFKAPKLFSNISSSSSSSHGKSQSIGTTKTTSSPRSSGGTAPDKYDPEDPTTHDVVLDIRKRTSLEDLHIIDSPPSENGSYTGGVTADDIYVHRREIIGEGSTIKRLSQHVSTDDLHLRASSGHVSQQGPSAQIPSIWLSVDAPKTPKERVDSLLSRSPNRNPYTKIKTLTKRYSLPFPLFNKSSPNSKVQPRNN